MQHPDEPPFNPTDEPPDDDQPDAPELDTLEPDYPAQLTEYLDSDAATTDWPHLRPADEHRQEDIAWAAATKAATAAIMAGKILEPPALHEPIHTTIPHCDTDLGRIDLGPIIRGETPPHQPALAYRQDGTGILYPQALHDLHGEPGHGKTWLCCYEAREILYAGQSLAFIDYEGTANTFIDRMRALGVDDHTLADPKRIAYHNLVGRVTPTEIRALTDQIIDMGIALTIIDSMLPAVIRQGLDDNDNTDLARFHDTITRPLALHCAVQIIDHVTKDATTRSRGSRGAGAKLQLVDVSYAVKLIQPFSRTQPGGFKLICAKDRFGTWSIGETIALVRLEPHDDQLHITVGTPEPRDVDTPFRPTRIMERISKALEHDGELNANALRAAVRGDDKTKPLALDLLVNEGFVTLRKDGQLKLYRSIKQYRENGVVTDFTDTEGDRW